MAHISNTAKVPRMHIPLLTPCQLGQILLSARKEKRLTQADFAARMGLSQSRISQIEANPEHMTAQQLLTATSILGLELSLHLRPQAQTPAADEW